MSDSAPLYPTDEERAEANFRWEYDTYTVDVHRMEDPPGSRAPLVRQRRRLVSEWESWTPEDA